MNPTKAQGTKLIAPANCVNTSQIMAVGLNTGVKSLMAKMLLPTARYGSVAVCRNHIRRAAGFGCIADTRRMSLRRPQCERLLSPIAVTQKVKFWAMRRSANGPQQSFNLLEKPSCEGMESAITGRSDTRAYRSGLTRPGSLPDSRSDCESAVAQEPCGETSSSQVGHLRTPAPKWAYRSFHA